MNEFILNKVGAKIYKDINKHSILEIPTLDGGREKGAIYEVLSVGMFPSGNPLITIKNDRNEVIAYKLPEELHGWCQSIINIAMTGVKIVPSRIEFGILNGKYYAEILQKIN